MSSYNVKIVSFSSHLLTRGKQPYTVWSGYQFEGAFSSMREAEEHARSLTTAPAPATQPDTPAK